MNRHYWLVDFVNSKSQLELFSYFVIFWFAMGLLGWFANSLPGKLLRYEIKWRFKMED